jgi:hypothetical protein
MSEVPPQLFGHMTDQVLFERVFGIQLRGARL